MMFTLDEEDEETEYGDTFKSSLKSSNNTLMRDSHGRIKYKRKPQEDEIEDEDEIDDEDDLNPA